MERETVVQAQSIINDIEEIEKAIKRKDHIHITIDGISATVLIYKEIEKIEDETKQKVIDFCEKLLQEHKEKLNCL